MSRIWARKFRRRDGETERQVDKGTRGRGEDSPCLPLSLSPCPSVPVAQLRIVVFGGSFAELDRLLAAFAGAGFVRGDIANVAKIIEVVQFAVAPGLKFDDFDKVCGGEESGGKLMVSLAGTVVPSD